MTRVPFHRRVFLWVFVLLFFILAPAAVFYTAGYRWNPKKDVIERNGTLILDTQPPGASIALNGEVISQRTPVTLQNVAPGTYRIRLQMDGFAVWEKTLDVRPERVTFVNDVWLWRLSTPSAVREGDVRGVAVSPNVRILARVEQSESGTRTVFESIPLSALATDDAITRTLAGTVADGPVQVDWNPSSNAVLVTDVSGSSWLVRRTGTGAADRLPDGNYRWDGNTLVGITGGERSVRAVFSADGSVAREPLPAGVADEEGLFRIVASTGTTRQSVVEQGRTERRFELPDGAWHFAEEWNGRLFVHDTDRWLGFDPYEANPRAISLPADAPPRALQRGREPLLLSRGESELWFVADDETPQLLVRSSDALTGAEWHEEGNHVFYSTSREVVALGLDPRDGRRQVTLATFDRVYGITVAGTVLFVAAETGGKNGVWMLEVGE